MQKSERTPGYKYRPIASVDMKDERQQTLDVLAVDGNGERGIDVRTAKPEDAKKAGDRRKRSPLV